MSSLAVSSAIPSANVLTLAPLKQDQTELLKKIQGLKASMWGRVTSLSELDRAPNEDIHVLLQHYFKSLVENLEGKDPIQQMDALLQALPIDALRRAVGSQDLAAEAKARFGEAKYHMSKMKGVSIAYQARLNRLFEGFIAALEGFMDAFGVGSFFSSGNNEVQTEFKSQRIMMLMSTFSMLTTALVPTIGAVSTAKIIGGMLLGFSALSLLWPHIKPKPTVLPGNSKCPSIDVEMGARVPEAGLEKELEIVKILEAGFHVLLVAPSRTGKTFRINGLADRINKGVYPGLKGMRIFRFNTTLLTEEKPSFMGGVPTLKTDIKKAIARYRDTTCLVLDEIHMACKDKAKLADNLKDDLDEDGDFAHVIGVTTDEEHKEVLANTAFKNRFKPVFLDTAGEDETLKVLRDEVLISPKKPLIEEGALEQIYAACPKGVPQPYTARAALKVRLGELGQSNRSANATKINEIDMEIKRKRAELAGNPNGAKSTALREKVVELKTARKTARNRLAKEESSVPLVHAKKSLDRALEIALVNLMRFKAKKDEDSLKRYWILEKYLTPALKSYVSTKADALGIKMELRKTVPQRA